MCEVKTTTVNVQNRKLGILNCVEMYREKDSDRFEERTTLDTLYILK